MVCSIATRRGMPSERGKSDRTENEGSPVVDMLPVSAPALLSGDDVRNGTGFRGGACT